MTNNKTNFPNDQRDKIETINRIDELENIVECHTRTQRYLEAHSNISSPEKISEAREKQAHREDHIEILEEKIATGQRLPSTESEGLEKNYTFAKGYMEHNQEHMSEEALENMKEKQQNRRDKMSGLN